MPFLRFGRDKRGYESTYLVHTGKDRGRSRARVLYFFRTPPAVRVGRAAFDAEAIRAIEAHHPEIDFDWTAILKGHESPAPAPRAEPERRARPHARDTRPQRAPAAVPPAALPPVFPATNADKADEARVQPVERADAPDAPRDLVEASEVATPVEEAFAPEGTGTVSASLARLGAEGLQRLRARHAEVLARITERVADPEQQDRLKADADRLNPDTWVTDSEVSAGLEHYEAVFESLRAVVGSRRKRRRRKGARRDASGLPGQSSGAADQSDVDDEGAPDSEPSV